MYESLIKIKCLAKGLNDEETEIILDRVYSIYYEFDRIPSNKDINRYIDEFKNSIKK